LFYYYITIWCRTNDSVDSDVSTGSDGDIDVVLWTFWPRSPSWSWPWGWMSRSFF
jgi:hypothetical protein